MKNTAYKIIYTHTDEAPALATYSFYPIIKAFAGACGVDIETRDISLAGRIVASFPDRLPPAQRATDDLAELARLATQPEANIIKLPNISASIPQLKAAIAELQAHGYNVPDYVDEPVTDEQRRIRAAYDKVKGSAVNPVLREGNSDRRAPNAVKEYARKNPHSMGKWSSDSKTHVAHMEGGDFRANEISSVIEADGTLRIELETLDGESVVLKEKVPVLKDEVVDATVLNVRALKEFLEEQIDDARRQDVLFSIHVKATMMKVSDPIIFGHVVKAFFRETLHKHAHTFAELGVNPNDGLGSLLDAIRKLPAEQQKEILDDLQQEYDKRPLLAMVNSDKGITNLHVPSDTIIDASMPAMIRTSGKMWNKDGKLQDTKAVIPDRSYAGVYQETIEFCKRHGAFDPRTMGTVPNVGLMAQAAEEYGSHDKTFEIPANGTVRVIDTNGNTLIEHNVEKGDIWRMCQSKDAAIQDWIKLAVKRARATGVPAIFWLDHQRPHDAELIKKIHRYLPTHDTKGLHIEIMNVEQATRFTLERLKNGQDTISVTGNVLRDYLTDLFPILEVGTSAKMLSIVPLMNGGGMFETGAGGSAPKHVQQFVAENHLRWDSLGEFLALAVSLEHLSEAAGNGQARTLAVALDKATERLLIERKSPSPNVRELDNRGSQFYLAMYWAQTMAEQSGDAPLRAKFIPLAKQLADNETRILEELTVVQGQPVDIGGYYAPNPELASRAMRPSATFNAIVSEFSKTNSI